ncbi:thermonuclease family protein [Planctomycetota bacterium]
MARTGTVHTAPLILPKIPRISVTLTNLTEAFHELEAAVRGRILLPDTDYKVVNVADGDTVELATGWKVRLYGIDTSEMHIDRNATNTRNLTGWEWYALEAGEHLRKRIGENGTVRLRPEPGEILELDTYNRGLAYVYLPDGTEINTEMVELGFAWSYSKYPCSRKPEFDVLHQEAKAAGRGMWNKQARKAWRKANVVPKVRFEKATLMVGRGSEVIHSLGCNQSPSTSTLVIFFRDLEQALSFHDWRAHRCMDASFYPDLPPEETRFLATTSRKVLHAVGCPKCPERERGVPFAGVEQARE